MGTCGPGLPLHSSLIHYRPHELRGCPPWLSSLALASLALASHSKQTEPSAWSLWLSNCCQRRSKKRILAWCALKAGYRTGAAQEAGNFTESHFPQLSALHSHLQHFYPTLVSSVLVPPFLFQSLPLLFCNACLFFF